MALGQLGTADAVVAEPLGLPQRRRYPQRHGYHANRTLQVVSWYADIKSPAGVPYKLVGYINDQHLVERVETWLENPVFGDMLVQAN